jgi:hypothetical protein
VQRAEYAPLRRAVALLELLTRVYDESPGRALTDQELLERVPAYGASEHAGRTLRSDKSALRLRGLVETNVRLPGETFLRGTRRARYLEKAPEWHLTEEEHEGLRAVREHLRRRHLTVGPTAPPATKQSRTHRVDEALRMVRLLEEHDGPVTVDVVAQSLSVGPQQARRWLRELADGFEVVVLEYGRDADDIGEDDIVSASLDRGPATPLTDTGTALLGLFPYSLAEVGERLDLLAAYHAQVVEGSVAEPVAEHLLDSVKWKLQSWSEHLRRT